jgi:hypothetical protein
MPAVAFNTSPTVDMETPLTKVKFAALTNLEFTQGNGGVEHVSPIAGVNTSPFAITAERFANTLPTGGPNVFGGDTHGHTEPPLSTPK